MTNRLIAAALLAAVLPGCAVSEAALDRVLGPACGPDGRALRAEGALALVARHRPAAERPLDAALGLLERLPEAASELADLRGRLADLCAHENKS